MRDEYIGDIGDFGKYILLNELRKAAGQARIGINWYHNMRPAPAFKYLFDDNAPAMKGLDGGLFDHFEKTHKTRTPKLSDITKADIMKGYHPFDQPIGEDRKKWFDAAWKELKDTNIVFLDPDNGLAPPTVSKSMANSVKYAFIDEIHDYYNGNHENCEDCTGKSVILYQHLNRQTQANFKNWLLAEVEKISPKQPPILIRCPRYMVRYYALIAGTEHHYTLFTNLCDTLTSKYGLLFESV